jgi:hypothetical protein
MLLRLHLPQSKFFLPEMKTATSQIDVAVFLCAPGMARGA